MVSSNGILLPPEQSFITTMLNTIKATTKRYRKNFAIASRFLLCCKLSPFSIFLSQLFMVIKKTTRTKITIPAAIIPMVFIRYLFCDTQKKRCKQSCICTFGGIAKHLSPTNKESLHLLWCKHFTNLLMGHILLIGDFPNVTCKK